MMTNLQILTRSRAESEIMLPFFRGALISIRCDEASIMTKLEPSNLCAARNRFFDRHSGPKLELTFDDVDSVGGRTSHPMHGIITTFQPPTRDDVRRALDFARDNKNEELLVHCRAGVSRSAGISLGVLMERTGDPIGAIDALIADRPQARPNPLIVNFADELLDLKGKLSNLIASWRGHSKVWEARWGIWNGI